MVEEGNERVPTEDSPSRPDPSDVAGGEGERADETAFDEDELIGEAYGISPRTQPRPEQIIQSPGEAGPLLQNISRADLREHYGPIRTLFKRRERLYKKFQRQLTQAWISRTYDQYLATIVARMLYIIGVSALLAVGAATGLFGAVRYGYLPDPSITTRLPLATVAGLTAGAIFIAGLFGAGLFWAWRRVIRIRSRIARRRRNINYNLPYAVTFMYALSRAGVGFDRVIARLARSQDAYGAVAQEFDRVVREVEIFGNNLYNGLQNLRAVTPSEELRRLTDDIIVILETGGDLPGFLRDEVDNQLETAVAEQEAFIERLELLSEVFVVGFVAAPLFVLVVLMVISFLGADTLSVMAALIYLIIPLGLVGFVVLIDTISEPFKQQPFSLAPERREVSAPPAPEEEPEWWEPYQRAKVVRGVRNRVREQVVRVRDEPWRAFLFSVPVGVLIPVIAVLSGIVPLRLSVLLANPVEMTAELAVAPLIVSTTPVAIVYEYRQGQERALQERFPDLLDLLATSNRRGLSLTQGLDIIASSTAGRLSDELRRLRNDIKWNADLPGAFEAFGDRLTSPALTRTVNLIAEGSRVTSDLYVVLGIAATDIAERSRLRRERRQTLQSYLAIVIIGFLVYLLVVLLLAANFLEPIEAFTAEAVTAEEGPVSLGAVPVSQLRVLLFHSALIQGFGSGLLAGKLAEDSLYSGLKYGISLVLLTILAFTIV